MTNRFRGINPHDLKRKGLISLSLSLYACGYFMIYIYIYLSVCLSIYLSIDLSIYTYIYMEHLLYNIAMYQITPSTL